MTEEDVKKSTFDYGRFEKMILPEWVLRPGHEEHKRVAVIAYGSVIIAIAILIILGSMALIRHEAILGLVDLSFAFVLSVIVQYHRQTRGPDHYAYELGVAVFGALCFYLFFFSGVGRATFLWSYTFPMMALSILGSRRGAIAAILFLAAIFLVLAVDPSVSFIISYPRGFKIPFIPSILAVLGLSYLYEKNREGNQRRLNLANRAFQKANEDIEKRVDERTAELQEAYQTLQQEMVEREHEEERRKQAEGMFRTMADTSRAGVFIVQQERFAYINKNAALYAGYTAEELTGVKAESLVHPADVESLKRNVAAMVRGERSAPYEYRIIRKDGGVHWIMETATSIMYQGERAILGNCMDVTEQKEVEERLRENEGKYRFLTERMSDIVWTMDLNMNLTYVSPSIAKISDALPEDTKTKLFFERATPESFQKVKKILVEEMEREKEAGVDPDRFLTIELEFYRRDGSTIWLENVVSGIRDNEGNLVGVHGVSRDITQRKVLEYQLLQAQKMEAIGTLAGGIAHDFNNLLFGVLGHASLIEMDLNLTQNQKERLRDIEDLVKSASALTSQLLGFARKGRYEVITTDMNELLEKTSTMFGRMRKDITVHKGYSEDLIPVEIDRTQLEQVFMNLFVNAGQAMPGGGSLYIETFIVTIRENEPKSAYLTPGRYVKISVTDTGTGMDEATKNRIFEPFFTTKEMGRGTGLGLAMVYGIVKGHNGHINVYSEEGHGTTFNIYLPVSQKAVIREPEPSTEMKTGHETILVVDDEKIVTDVTRNILERFGYQVLVAGGGEQAIEVYGANRERIALVILDLIMPGMGGSETFDRLREINPDVKVILSSGYSINGQAKTVIEKGCRAFIQKPISIAELSRKVREVLEK